MWMRLTFKHGTFRCLLDRLACFLWSGATLLKLPNFFGCSEEGTVIAGFAFLSAEGIFGICSPFSFLSTQMLTKFFFF
jgi:hypothetical protein